MADGDNPYHTPFPHLQSNNQFLLAIQQVFPYNVFVVPNHNNCQRGAVSQFYQNGGPPVNAQVVGLVQSREIADSIAHILNGMHDFPAIGYSINQLSNCVHQAQSVIAQFVDEYHSRGAQYFDFARSYQWPGGGEWYELNRNVPVTLLSSYNTQHIVDKPGPDAGYHATPRIGMSMGNQNNQYSGNTSFDHSESFPSTDSHDLSLQYPQVAALAESCRAKEAAEAGIKIPKSRRSRYVADVAFYIELRKLSFAKDDYLKNFTELNEKYPEKSTWIKEKVSLHFPVDDSMASNRNQRLHQNMKKLRLAYVAAEATTSTPGMSNSEARRSLEFPSKQKVEALAMECRSLVGLNNTSDTTQADELFVEKLRLEMFGREQYLQTTRALQSLYPASITWLKSQLNEHFPLHQDKLAIESRKARIRWHLHHLRQREEYTVVNSQDGRGKEDSMAETSKSGKPLSRPGVRRVSFENTVALHLPRCSTVRPLPSKKKGIRNRSVVPSRSYSLPTDIEVEYIARRLPKTTSHGARRDVMFFMQLQSKLFQKIEQYGTDPHKQAWVWRQMNIHFPEKDTSKNPQRKACLACIARKKKGLRLRPIPESSVSDNRI